MQSNAVLLYLFAFLSLYLGPLYLIFVGGVLFSGFDSRIALVDATIAYVITDQGNQEMFVRIIMPLLVGLTSGSILKSIVSLPSALLSIVFIVSLGVASVLMIELGTENVATLLESRSLPVDKLKAFVENMREALVTSLTITLGISASKQAEANRGSAQTNMGDGSKKNENGVDS